MNPENVINQIETEAKAKRVDAMDAREAEYDRAFRQAIATGEPVYIGCYMDIDGAHDLWVTTKRPRPQAEPMEPPDIQQK